MTTAIAFSCLDALLNVLRKSVVLVVVLVFESNDLYFFFVLIVDTKPLRFTKARFIKIPLE